MTRSVDPVVLSRRWRAVLAAVLSLLGVGMQQEGLRHALSHVRAAHPQQQAATAVVDVPCAECALLASGAAALTAAVPERAAFAGAAVAAAPAYASPARRAPAYYRSRAPPFLS